VNSELVENFGGKIREARERLELSHKELSKKINEKISVLKKLETEKMIPDQKLVSKLEYALKIKLFMHTSEKDISQSSGFTKTVNPEITLGDLIQFNKDD
jgi:putative transcription factor